jgi:hypothetical protein
MMHIGNRGSIAQAEWRSARVHIVRRGDVAQMKQLEVNFCAVEVPKVVVRSLGNIRAARRELLPATTNLPTAAALVLQIKLRVICLNEVRAIRARLKSANQIERRHRFANAVSVRRTKDASFRSCKSKPTGFAPANKPTSAPLTQEFADLNVSAKWMLKAIKSREK